MQNILISNYAIDIYAIFWCLYILWLGIKGKHAHLIAWSLAQTIIFGLDALNRFINKGYCIFSSCEPTLTIKKFFDVSFSEDTIALLRFISMTLMFFAILKMHKFIDKELKK